jgi:hypothetical protein
MKRTLSALLMVVLLSDLSFARSKDSITINFSTPVEVGSKTLPEGDCRMTWTGSGPTVQVSFAKGKTVVTVPAKLVPAQNHWVPLTNTGYEAETKQGNGVMVLEEIRLPHLNLFFGTDATTRP